MKRRLLIWDLGGFLWTGAAGTLLHFLYGWSGGSTWAAALSPVSESVWEHMKLLFVPLFLFTIAQLCLMGRTESNLLAVRGVSALTGLVLIPVLYYTYTGALGLHLLWADIAIFFLADLVLFWLDYRLLSRGRCFAGWQQLLGAAALWALAFCFVWCSFRPPALPLWQEPDRAVQVSGR